MRGLEIALTLTSVVLIGFGQILFQLAARDATFAGFTWNTVASWLTPAMLAALAISTLATGLWVWVLRTASLAVVYPLYALTFIVVPLLEWLLTGTAMTPRSVVGAAAIVAGVWMMAGAAT